MNYLDAWRMVRAPAVIIGMRTQYYYYTRTRTGIYCRNLYYYFIWGRSEEVNSEETLKLANTEVDPLTSVTFPRLLLRQNSVKLSLRKQQKKNRPKKN